ncbi:MAG: metallophosphoesterase [Candidatus ainarchaeum sp.]|nr:metallophosphoesterase [Candidatus ainarchaeum sp.]
MYKKVIFLLLLFTVIIVPLSFADAYNLQHYNNTKSSFYTGGHPGKSAEYKVCDYTVLKQTLDSLKSKGVNKIIVLGGECTSTTTSLGKSYLTILKDEGFDYAFINLGSVIMEKNQKYNSEITKAFSWLDSAKNDVYVHCWWGKHRTGAFVARWLTQNNLVSQENANYQRIMQDLKTLKPISESVEFTKWTNGSQTVSSTYSLSNATYNGKEAHIVEIDPSQYTIKVVTAKSITGSLTSTVQEMVEKSGAVIGVNASFFNVNDKSAGYDCSKPDEINVPLGLVVENKQEKYSYLGNQEWDCHLMNPPHFPDNFLVINNNIPEILNYTEYKQKYPTSKPDYALQSAALKYNGTKQCDLGNNYCSNRSHSATYACVTNDNKLLLAVFNKAGATYPTTFDSKCKSIINLDGGGSSTLIAPEKNIYYWGYKDDGKSQREVPTAILIFKKTGTTTTSTTTTTTKTKTTTTTVKQVSLCEMGTVSGNILCQVEKMLNTFFKTELDKNKKTNSSAGSFSFAVVSDTHITTTSKTNTEYLEKAMSLAKSNNVSFVIGLGDLIESVKGESGVSTDEQAAIQQGKDNFAVLSNSLSKTNLLFLPVVGNHDYQQYNNFWSPKKDSIIAGLEKGNSSNLNFTGTFPKYYAFTYNNNRFIIWYAVGSGNGGQLDADWLISELNNATDKGYSNVLVFAHYPLSDVTYAKSYVQYNRDKIISALKSAGATYFAGHTHVYYLSQVEGVEQVLIGTLSNRTQYSIDKKNTNSFPKNFIIVNAGNNLAISPFSGNSLLKGFDTAKYWPSNPSTIAQNLAPSELATS